MIWTRLLSLLFGATVYTFSLILAVFLVGLGIGSSAGAAHRARHRVAAARARLVPAAAVRRDRWAAYVLTESLPYWPINPSIATTPWFTFQLDLVRCLWVVLPGAILWGASFPLALAAVATTEQDRGAAGRRRLRGEHRRRDRRLAGDQLHADPVDRHASTPSR